MDHQLCKAKFGALLELERTLPYAFSSRERELVGESGYLQRYCKPTVVETSGPAIFVLLFLGAVFH